jgi:ribulose-bisphosphate carboxylase large chain
VPARALTVTYHIRTTSESVTELAEALALEQSVETPLHVARRYPVVEREMLGEVAGTEKVQDGWLVTLALPVATASVDPAQFLNVIFGNASMFPGVTLVGFDLPAEAIGWATGPTSGLEGLREAAGAPGQVLTCTAIKPVGLDVAQLSDLCYRFALGGIHIIKDDHYLADHPFAPFRERVSRCMEMINRAADETGRRTLYAPNLSGTPGDLRRQAEYALTAGAGAVMMAPMQVGLPAFHEIARSIDVPVLAHPSFSGGAGVAPDIMMGRLFRLYGADAVIFPGYGGRFSYTKEECLAIADAARSPWHQIRAAAPTPAGGIRIERVSELIETFGRDTMLLVGGSLLEAAEELTARTRAFTEAVAQA